MLSLLPTHVQLPGEIISMIAEATVEPFSLELDHHIRNNDPSNELTITGLPIYHLAFISRTFQHGVDRGLRNNYTGRLILRVGYIRRAKDLLRRYGLDWIIPETKYLHIHLLEDNFVLPDETTDFQQYNNLEDITVTHIRKAMYSDLDYNPVYGSPDNRHNTTSVVRNVLTFLQPRLSNRPISIVKVALAMGPERVVTLYQNVEVQICRSKYCRYFLQHYKTDTLEWDIRSPPPDPCKEHE